MLSRCVFEDEDEGRVLAPLIWQPLDRVHDYCGGHVALYFAWVGHAMTIPYHTPAARGDRSGCGGAPTTAATLEDASRGFLSPNIPHNYKGI